MVINDKQNIEASYPNLKGSKDRYLKISADRILVTPARIDWNPVEHHPLICPQHKGTLKFHCWSHTSRYLYTRFTISHLHLATYICVTHGHLVQSTSTDILNQVPSDYHPFLLTYRAGVDRDLFIDIGLRYVPHLVRQ